MNLDMLPRCSAAKYSRDVTMHTVANVLMQNIIPSTIMSL